jgi:hypothetical protein
MVNVLANLLFGYPSQAGTKIATRPDVLSPVAFLQVRKLLLQATRRGAFQVLHDFGRTQTRWATDQPMNRLFADRAFQNVNGSAHADWLDKVARSLGNFALQKVVAIFGHPHPVILDILHRMRPCALVVPALLRSLYYRNPAQAIRLKAKVLDLALGK